MKLFKELLGAVSDAGELYSKDISQLMFKYCCKISDARLSVQLDQDAVIQLIQEWGDLCIHSGQL